MIMELKDALESNHAQGIDCPYLEDITGKDRGCLKANQSVRESTLPRLCHCPIKGPWVKVPGEINRCTRDKEATGHE